MNRVTFKWHLIVWFIVYVVCFMSCPFSVQQHVIVFKFSNFRQSGCIETCSVFVSIEVALREYLELLTCFIVSAWCCCFSLICSSDFISLFSRSCFSSQLFHPHVIASMFIGIAAIWCRRRRRRFCIDLDPLLGSSFPVDLWAGDSETQLS